MNTLRMELRRAVCSVGCLLAAVGTALVLLGTAWPELAEALERGRLYAGFSGAAVLNALTGDTFSLSLSILSPLAYSGTWAEEWGSGYLRAYLPRTTRKSYLVSRCLACVISGGVGVTAGLLCAWLLVRLGLCTWEIGKGGLSLLPLVTSALRLFCSGGLWAITGMALSSWWESSAMAYGGPFVVYYVLIILYERYLSDCFPLSPREWLTPGEGWPLQGWSALGVVCGVTAGMALLFSQQAGRRLRQL